MFIVVVDTVFAEPPLGVPVVDEETLVVVIRPEGFVAEPSDVSEVPVV